MEDVERVEQKLDKLFRDYIITKRMLRSMYEFHANRIKNSQQNPMDKRMKDAAKYSISSGAVGMYLSAILCWALSAFAKVDVPVNVAVAFTGLFAVLANLLLAQSGILSDV